MQATQPRAALAGLTFSLGLASITADLLPVTASRSTKSSGVSFTNVCPKCPTAQKVNQQYWCSHDPTHGPYGQNDTHKALESAKGLMKVSAAYVADVRAPVEDTPSKHSDLGVYPASQVEAHTAPTGTPYRLRPKKGTEVTYALFLHVVANPEVAFLCEMSVKKVTNLYRMIARDGVLTLVELGRPEEMYPAAPVTADLTPQMIARAEELVDFMTEEFDPELFGDRRRARMDALRERVLPVEEIGPKKPAKFAANDLLALLERSVAAA